VKAGLGRLTWKVLLYFVVAVLLGGLTRDRMLTGLLTAGFVFGDRSVAAVVRARTRPGGPTGATTPTRGSGSVDRPA
jgi:hypothetical protein